MFTRLTAWHSNRKAQCLCTAVLCWLFLIATIVSASRAAGPQRIVDCYISTGDNHWLARSLPIDSPATIESTMRFLKRLGVRRIYWRGLEEAAWLHAIHIRKENRRYARFWQRVQRLYRELDALLDIGGTEIREGLDELRTQEKDEQLALLAWKTLYVPQRGGTFSQVTEQQNESAFEHLPRTIKERLSTRDRQHASKTVNTKK